MKNGASTIDTTALFWSAATVAAVIDTKKDQRQQKGRESNCFAVRNYDTDAPVGTPENEKFELEIFLTSLKESINKGNFNGDDLKTNRFQLLVQNGAHWTPFDITIKNKKLHVISMDAAGSPSQEDSLRAIEKHFPSTTFYSFGIDCVVQMDNNSCSRFSLDAAFKIQNIDDPISLIERHIAISNARQLKHFDKDFTGREFLLAPKDVPKEMAFFFRNIQSGSMLAELPPALLNSPVNKKNEFLKDYAEKNTKIMDINGQQKKRYLAIETVKTKLSDNTQIHLQNLSGDQQSQLRERAKGIEFIKSNRAQRAQMNKGQRKVALASEFVKTHSEKNGLFSYYSHTNQKLRESKKIIAKMKPEASKQSEPPKKR